MRRYSRFIGQCLALLRSISENSPDAEVFWRNRRIGKWISVDPQWGVVGGKLWFRFRFEGRALRYWILGVRPAGASIRIVWSTPRGSRFDALQVVPRDRIDRSSGSEHPILPDALSWMRSRFPGLEVSDVVRRCDRARSLSGAFTCIRGRHLGVEHLALLMPSDSQLNPGMLTQGLLWIRYLCSKKSLRAIPTLHLLVMRGEGGVVRHRASCLDPRKIRVRVWEYDPSAIPVRFGISTVAPPPREGTDFQWPPLGPFRWSAPLSEVLDMAPGAIRRHPRSSEHDSLRILGMEFARVLGAERNRILFGVGRRKTELCPGNMGALRSLVNEILYYRRADSPNPHHPYYRLQSERWLESLVLEDASRLFPELSPRAVYTQIPVYLGSEPGRVDVLAVDLSGTLVVLEIKAREDPDLPLQSLDYWGRVLHHHRRGDFKRRGYFSEMRLTQQALPKIYLVAPIFSFHDTTEFVLGFARRNLEVWKIAVNEDWRSGVRVLERRRVCT